MDEQPSKQPNVLSGSGVPDDVGPRAEDDYRAVGPGTFLSRVRFVCVRSKRVESVSALPCDETTCLLDRCGEIPARLRRQHRRIDPCLGLRGKSVAVVHNVYLLTEALFFGRGGGSRNACTRDQRPKLAQLRTSAARRTFR